MTIEPKNLIIDILLTLLTGGLWNLWVQYRQMKNVNTILKRDSFSPFWTLVFSLLTFGIYFFYHEYKLTDEIYTLTYGVRNKDLAMLCGPNSI